MLSTVICRKPIKLKEIANIKNIVTSHSEALSIILMQIANTNLLRALEQELSWDDEWTSDKVCIIEKS